MVQRVLRAAQGYARQAGSPSATRALNARTILSRFFTTARHALMVFGIAAIATLALMFVRPELADHLASLSPFNTAVEETTAAADEPDEVPTQSAAETQRISSASAQLKVADKKAGNNQQQQRVTQWLSKRYRVAGDAANLLVSASYRTAQELKLDPLLILSVMAIESGLNPFAESPFGAQGLMQVMSKVHHDKFQALGGIEEALNPVSNIKVGAQILKEYVTRSGSVEAGLKMYVGAALLPHDSGYGAKVLSEYRRLQDVANGKNVSTTANGNYAIPRTAEPKPAAATEAMLKPTTPPNAGVKNDQLAMVL